ncbi:MAG: CapA family protein [Peptococcaceae bacterium]|jgi:poly-gamma-glutamate synthesis protein (capsule biosynthesis protein)|nr:CapA family protein [Peptococcaceae bacterium]
MSKILLGLVGETNVNRSKPETAFIKVQPLLDRTDVLFGHMETTLSDHPSDNDDIPDLPYKRGWLHSKPVNAEAWKTAGFDAVGAASNVCGSTDSIARTVQELDQLGIPHAGIGINITEARKPAIIEKNGAKIGFLSYTSVFYSQFVPALAKRPGAATVKARMSIIPSWRSEEMPGAMPVVKTWLDEKEKALMLEDIMKLRPRVDYVVMSCHWGVSNAENVQDYQIELAHSAIDAGADAVMGHHPHCPQAVELYKEKPIFYSMGNFAFDWWFVRDILKEGIMAYITLENGSVTKTSFVPVRREDESNDVAAVSPGSEAGVFILDMVRKLSAPFGTKFEIVGDEVVVTA